MNGLTFHEWRIYTPESEPALADRRLDDVAARHLASDLRKTGRLKVLELREGLEVETTSWVGTVRLGDLHITVLPKLQGLPLLNLLRYAYGLRNLLLFEPLSQGLSNVFFHDLLIYQLAAEVDELLARGLHRYYQREETLLASPRGRINFTALAQQMTTAKAALPCIHHPRKEDTPHNRALLGGMRLGMWLTSDPVLRDHLRRQIALLIDHVTPVHLTTELLQQVQRQSDRLTEAYRPALAICELLLAGWGTALQNDEETVTLPGFLFDMNRFFQTLISRFLHEYLPGYIVRDEQHLRGILTYNARHNPLNRRAPTLRPDFVILQGARIMAVLDAKYRDLWETPLPREMLYQLVMYTSTSESSGRAVILYPTLNPAATEQCIEVRDPLAGRHRAEVILRPVDMLRLEKLVAGPRSARQERDAVKYAHYLAVGEQ